MTAKRKPEEATVELSGRQVGYSIRRSAGAKRRRIRVTPNGVEVVLPKAGDARKVPDFLRDNGTWVLEQLDFIERSSGVIRRRTKPNTMLLRGEERVIRIVEVDTGRRYGIVAEAGSEIVVQVPAGGAGLAQRALELWLRKLARIDLKTALDRRAKQMKLKFGRVFIMNQRTRWGGCSSRSNLSFSWRLVMAPPAALDYLAVHELAHLVEANHSARFWLTVRSFCPDFEKPKKWLRDNEWRLRMPLI